MVLVTRRININRFYLEQKTLRSAERHKEHLRHGEPARTGKGGWQPDEGILGRL